MNRSITARVLAVAAVLLAVSSRPAAHDLPTDLTLQAFVATEEHRLRLLLRVPLIALVNDVDLPRRGPGYLDLDRIEEALRDSAAATAGTFELYEGEARLTQFAVVDVRVALPSDRSFGSYEAALAHVTGPRLPPATNVYWNQGFLDVLLDYPIRSPHSDFGVRPRVAALGGRVITVLRFLPAAGVVRAYELVGNPGIVRLDPRWHQAAQRFVEAGFSHLFDGIDHLLFLFALVIPCRRFRTLIPIVTAFTVAHSITLIASAYNLAPPGPWFQPFIEALIALSILYMAFENIIAANLRRRWVIAFGFGLIHGFGFSFALRETLQFAGSHLLTSLLSFNVGLELGQLVALALLVPALAFLFRFVVDPRIGTILLSVLVAHSGWHWMVERADQLGQVDWPLVTMLDALRWATALIIVAGLVWLVSVVLPRRPRPALDPAVDRRTE